MSGGGRLGLVGAMQRQNVFSEVPVASDTNSASTAHLQRELKAMKDENSLLRKQLEESRSTLDLLLKQKSHECFDERRVNLLKCQLIQQERQILVLNESLGTRAGALMEVENALSWLADTCRVYIAEDTRTPSVPVPRSDLTKMVETVESARIKLFKDIENSTSEKLAKPLMFMNEFLRPNLQQEWTLLDVVSGGLEHINLKQVSQLESKLSGLYKELIRLHALLTSDKVSNQRLCSSHMTSVIKDRLNTQVLRSCAMMKTCSDDLLSLSLLYPCAPWPALKRTVIRDVSVEDVVASLPPLPRAKAQDVQHVVQAVLKVCNYRHHMLDKEVKCLREEVKFHQAVYGIQLEYCQAVLDAVKDGYCEFEKSAGEVIVKPLSDVLEAYDMLSATAGEDALRHFLATFKDNEQQFSEAVVKLNINNEDKQEEKTAALTAFGEEFMDQLNRVVGKRQEQRDKEAGQKHQLKTEQEKIEEELRSLLKEMELDRIEEKNISVKSETEQKEMEIDKERIQLSGGKSNPVKSSSKTSIRSSQSDYRINYEKPSSARENDKCEDEKDYEKGETVAKSHRSKPKTESSSKSLSSKPPVHKDTNLPKPSYKPNLIVPNRTLQLRRSGSLSRLAGSEVKESEENQGSEVLSERVSMIRRRSESPNVSKLPSRKTPFRDGYCEFEKSAGEVIVKPLSDVLEAYDMLSATAGEDALRHFLATFKDNEQQFSEAVVKLNINNEDKQEEKTAALTAFGEEFMDQLNRVVGKRQEQRDKEAGQKHQLKTEQEKIEEELRSLLKEMELDRIEEKNISVKSETEQKEMEIDKERIQLSGGKSNPVKSSSKTSIRSSQSDYRINYEKPSSARENDKCEDEKDYEKGETVAKSHRSKPKTESSSKSLSSKPPVHKDTNLPKPSYKPNLIVPNRTLQLRRSGSLSRLAGSEVKESEENQGSEVLSERVSMIRRRSESPNVSKLPSRKTPFR